MNTMSNEIDWIMHQITEMRRTVSLLSCPCCPKLSGGKQNYLTCSQILYVRICRRCRQLTSELSVMFRASSGEKSITFWVTQTVGCWDCLEFSLFSLASGLGWLESWAQVGLSSRASPCGWLLTAWYLCSQRECPERESGSECFKRPTEKLQDFF